MIVPFDHEISLRLDMIIIDLETDISPVRRLWLCLCKMWNERKVPRWP